MKMGTIIFLTAAIVEIAFAVFCIITKSYQQKIRSIARITAFTGFVLFTVLTIIDWGIRYYALAAFLLLMAIMGAVALILKREEKRGYKAVRVVMKAVGMTGLIFVVTLPAIIFPQYKEIEATGQYKVSTTTYTYTDMSRVETYTNTGENRKLSVGMWYPQNAKGTYPLIVFSHGSLGLKTSNQTLYNELASHGYVVCSIDHTYQCFFTTDKDGNKVFLDMSYMRELTDELNRDDREFSFKCYQKWMKLRMGDISFVIDNILSQAGKSDADEVYKLVDNSKIGVMGHSLGGSAALGIGRARNDVSAVIALESPFMYDVKGVQDGELVFTDDKYPVPVLNVYSDDSWSHLGEWYQYVENYTLLSSTNTEAFNVYISGVGHLALTNLGIESPFLASMLNEQKSAKKNMHSLKILNKISLEFFDCYLKEKGRFTSSGTY
jgi:dienelactone hydrolase